MTITRRILVAIKRAGIHYAETVAYTDPVGLGYYPYADYYYLNPTPPAPTRKPQSNAVTARTDPTVQPVRPDADPAVRDRELVGV